MFGIIPREEKYFDLFNEMAAQINLAAETLVKLFDDIANAERYAAELKSIEHRADEIAHDVLKRLNKSFITPIDREDIYALINALDTIVDVIEGLAARVIMYGVKESTLEMKELARLLVETAAATGRAVEKIHSHEDMSDAILEVHRLESGGDATFRAAVRELFSRSSDALAIMKCKEIYEKLEDSIDACEDAADVLENIRLKNA
ncbi:MAG TPA: DUF47 family protein [Blastocatellia bacterium]|nr:DUF47 family protein [Blastocatellia bacterium]